MSLRYKGGVISATPPTTTGGNSGVASGNWTLEQQFQAQGAGNWPNQPVYYIEDVFQTWLYTGNGSTQTITNGIDLAGKGGLIWAKSRTSTNNHGLYDSARGFQNVLNSASTIAQQNYGSTTISSVSSTGFSIGSDIDINSSGNNFVSWTFRKQPKFFDVVTYTGNGSTNRTIPHSLGSTPGCMIIKCTTSAGNWQVYHTSVGTSQSLQLNTTVTPYAAGDWSSAPDANNFYIARYSALNNAGDDYVAYLFANNAGGFGLTGTDNVISCGSLSGAGTTVNLGWEPQWILAKRTDNSGNWYIDDNMRGWPAAPSNDNPLLANSSASENGAYAGFANITSTGFTNNFNGNYIYIAIRRGPMKTPTSGTSVYNATTWTGNNTIGRTLATGLSSPPDLAITQWRNGLQANLWWDMLRGFSTTAGDNSIYLRSQETTAEVPLASYFYRPDMVNVGFGSIASSGVQLNGSSSTLVGWFLRRAPGFFDEVCYTGDGTGGSGRAITHNLGVAPELVIVKSRSNATDWRVWQTSFSTTYNILLNSSAAQNANFYLWANTYLAVTNPTTQFGVYGDGTTNSTNTSGATYVAYLFASCPGVSKVGSYTGTGATQTINCGFTGGARWVMIKRTDSTGDWYVWDTARGMVSGTDPSLLLNSTAAEVNANSVYTTSVGFQIVSTAAGINASGGSYIFLAIA